MVNSQRLTRAGVRAVAAFEGVKGLLVLVAGFGLFGLLHRDAQHGAETLVRHLHLNPARHISRVFIKAAGRLTNTRLLLLAGGALAYAALRFVEAYGLWRERPWAEWLAIVAAGLYLPIEVFEVIRHRTLLSAGLLLANVLIVVGLLYVRLSADEG